MRPTQRPDSTEVTYSHDQQWVIAGSPDHYGVSVQLSPAENGHIGSNILYLGKFNLKTREVGCQEFEVIVPNSARMFDTEGRLEELEIAAKALPVGHKYQTVRVFVSPKDLGAAGGYVPEFQNEAVIVDNPQPGRASVLWIHEYVHTLQGFRTQPELAWLYEGSATYLSLRVAVEHGEITPRAYDYYLQQGAREFNTTLTAAQSERVAYRRGAVVLAILDRELATTYDRSVVGLMTELSEVRNPGTEDVVRWLRDDVGMDEHGAEHTVRLVESDDVLHPPLLVADSKTPEWFLSLLAQISATSVRAVCAAFGVLFVVVYVDEWRQSDESEAEEDS